MLSVNTCDGDNCTSSIELVVASMVLYTKLCIQLFTTSRIPYHVYP